VVGNIARMGERTEMIECLAQIVPHLAGGTHFVRALLGSSFVGGGGLVLAAR